MKDIILFPILIILTIIPYYGLEYGMAMVINNTWWMYAIVIVCIITVNSILRYIILFVYESMDLNTRMQKDLVSLLSFLGSLIYAGLFLYGLWADWHHIFGGTYTKTCVLFTLFDFMCLKSVVRGVYQR